MREEFERGDDVEVTYVSDRSGNEVSRKGEVLQSPNGDDKNVLFVETGDDQLTGVTGGKAFSVSVDDDGDGGREVTRTTELGDVESVEAVE